MANDGETCHPALTTKKMRLFFVLLFLRLDVSFLFCFFYFSSFLCWPLFYVRDVYTDDMAAKWWNVDCEGRKDKRFAVM